MKISLFYLPTIGSRQEMERGRAGLRPELRVSSRACASIPAQWIFAWTYNGLIPHAQLMRSTDAFATQVLPRVATPA